MCVFGLILSIPSPPLMEGRNSNPSSQEANGEAIQTQALQSQDANGSKSSCKLSFYCCAWIHPIRIHSKTCSPLVYRLAKWCQIQNLFKALSIHVLLLMGKGFGQCKTHCGTISRYITRTMRKSSRDVVVKHEESIPFTCHPSMHNIVLAGMCSKFAWVL